jgi:hypothetical protein
MKMHIIISLAWAGFVFIAPGFRLRALYAASHKKIGINCLIAYVMLKGKKERATAKSPLFNYGNFI